MLTNLTYYYLHRKENELAVLIQYIDRNKSEPPAATHLDIILYSREQIIKENLATGDVTADTTAPWGIISVKVNPLIVTAIPFNTRVFTLSIIHPQLFLKSTILRVK